MARELVNRTIGSKFGTAPQTSTTIASSSSTDSASRRATRSTRNSATPAFGQDLTSAVPGGAPRTADDEDDETTHVHWDPDLARLMRGENAKHLREQAKREQALLMLLPGMLRRALPGATIGFFLHIPFPSFEVFRMLPNAWRKEILEGLLGADLAGFHTNFYAQYFLSSVKQLLGYEVPLRSVITTERSVAVDVFPVGIDFEKFHGVMNVREVFEERNRIRKRLGEARLVISVDRLDYTKGIVNRLEGFELFLSEHPEYRSRVSFLMIIVPSRDIIMKYRELKETIEGMVGRINGKFGTLDWTPVIYQYRSVDFNELAGMYAAADAALITPVRDGMNLVAKEFVASRADKRGVLVLSEFAGGGIGRMLVQAMAKDLTRRGVRAIEAFGDRRWESPACMMPVDYLLSVGFKTIRPHHHYPRLRMELRTVLTWREDVEVALERLLGSMTPAAPQGALRPV